VTRLIRDLGFGALAVFLFILVSRLADLIGAQGVLP
jgi:hypothetical protein